MSSFLLLTQTTKETFNGVHTKGLLHLLSRCAENHDGYNSWSKWSKLNTIVKYHEMKLMSTDWSTIDPQKTLEDHSRFLMKLKTLAAQYLLCQLLLSLCFVCTIFVNACHLPWIKVVFQVIFECVKVIFIILKTCLATFVFLYRLKSHWL